MITIENWGLISYSEAWERQTALFDELIDAKLNGKPYTRNYITHQDIVNGGVMKFVMGDKPNKEWGTAAEDCPPTVIE